jgi:tricorn protease
MICLFVTFQFAPFVAAAEIDLPRFPAASPDGNFVTFTWRGDLWKGAADGGAATRLTSHPADESRSVWSPDGSMIAFESTRDGGRNLYTIDPMGGSLRRVTNTDEILSISSFSTTPTGEPALDFSASLDYDLFRSPRPYFVALTGGEPTRRHGAFGRAAVPSPDGKRFLFERGGSDWNRRGYRGSDNCDVWMYDTSATGDAMFVQLTDFQGNDGWAQWRNDSSFLFLSDRDLATVNVFVQDANGKATARRLTGFEGQDVKDLSVSRDGRRAFFTVWDKLYRLDLDTTGAVPIAMKFTAPDDTFDSEEVKSLASAATEIALNPDGKSAALVAFGDVWIKPIEGKYPARRVTNAMAREYEIAWSPDGQTLYFTSDADGGDSIMTATVATTREDVVATAKVLEPKPIEPAPAPTPVATPAVDPAPTPEPVATPAVDPATAPAPVAIPVVDPEPLPATTKPTKKPAEKGKEKDKPKSERWAEAVRFEVAPLISGATNDRQSSPSPDGKSLAFRRGRGDIMMMDLASREVRTVREGWDPDIDLRWSPDSRWLSFTNSDRDFNSDIFIAPADGSTAPINVTRHPDNDGSPRWSADSRILSFVSERTNEEVDVWMVFLDKSLEGLPKFELDKYFKDAAEAAKKRKPLGKVKADKTETAEKTDASEKADKPDEEKTEVAEKSDKAEKSDNPEKSEKPEKKEVPVVLSLDDAYRRVRRVSSMPGNEGNLEISPAGDRMYFTGGELLDGGLFVINWDGTGQRKLGSRTSVQGISLTGEKLITLSGGKGQLLSTSGGPAPSTPAEGSSSSGGTSIDIDSSIVIDQAALVSQKFAEAQRLMGENFYHPTMKGLDWGAVSARYAELATHARTPSEFDHVANRLLGELNASHLGIRSPQSGGRTVLPQGRIGVMVSSATGGLRVDAMISDAPAMTAKTPLMIGDIITGIDFDPIRAGDTLSSRMAGTIGREVVLSINRTLADGRDVSLQTAITPVTDSAIGRLAYQATQTRNAKLVDEWSGGRLGYIHIEGMAQPALDEFERDLYAACDGKDGLLIDVRNNGGGWTADRLLASICSPIHAYTVPRGADPKHTDGYPQDRLFIQRFTGPVNMLCNEKSFSNAEIVAHAFKTLQRGTLVGMPTYGGVISTGSASLLDGTTVRMPTRGWYLLNGKDMEMNGAVPDILVAQTPQDESANSDRQLRAAVENLLQRTPKSSATQTSPVVPNAAAVPSGG